MKLRKGEFILVLAALLCPATLGWAQTTMDEPPAVRLAAIALKEMSIVGRGGAAGIVPDWEQSSVSGTYAQGFGSASAEGKILTFAEVKFDDGTQYPAFVVEGQFFLPRRTGAAQTGRPRIAAMSTKPNFAVKQQVWVSKVGSSKVFLAEGISCFLLDPNQMARNAQYGAAKDFRNIIVGVLDSDTYWFYEEVESKRGKK